MTRDDQIQAFLTSHGWADARRTAKVADASDRRYFRLALPRHRAILMDAPPGKGDDPADFLRMSRHLTKIGLSAPTCLHHDLATGFLLLEDFGDIVLAQRVAANPDEETALYTLATDAALHLAAHPAPEGLAQLSAQDWAEAAAFAPRFYGSAMGRQKLDETELVRALAAALSLHADQPPVLIHRDYHAENLMLLPRRSGLRRLGILDFQLAQMGQPGYDLVSLCQDARRDVSPATEAAMRARYAAGRGMDLNVFEASYAVLGAQRALRILGIFARLATQSGKPRYLPMIPRVWGQLQANLRHPALADLANACQILPPPTPEALSKIATP